MKEGGGGGGGEREREREGGRVITVTKKYMYNVCRTVQLWTVYLKCWEIAVLLLICKPQSMIPCACCVLNNDCFNRQAVLCELLWVHWRYMYVHVPYTTDHLVFTAWNNKNEHLICDSARRHGPVNQVIFVITMPTKQLRQSNT